MEPGKNRMHNHLPPQVLEASRRFSLRGSGGTILRTGHGAPFMPKRPAACLAGSCWARLRAGRRRGGAIGARARARAESLLPWGQAAMPEAILVLTTCASLIEGETIAKQLLERKLVACANLGSHMHSYFVWHGQAQEATEYPLLLKTLRDRFREVEAEIRKLHSYENPEIIAVPIVAASADYLDWIASSVAVNTAAPKAPEG